MTQDSTPTTGPEAVQAYLEQLYETPTLTPAQRARMQKNWETVNAKRIRSERQRAFWYGVAWALTGGIAVLLFWLIFGWAVANAMADAAIAPVMIRH